MGSCLVKEVSLEHIIITNNNIKSDLESGLLENQENQENQSIITNNYVYKNNDQDKIKTKSISSDNSSIKNNISTDTDSTIITNKTPFISYFFTKSNEIYQ